ncbi:DMT family transporter [Octadecabacter ascidiaceicola]|uniref:EamA-like transporter family protein n=1 Tax=Octadecabacter ascidiaceicola TaxID=1655543 RepID=A0A238K5M5_9RHOB|nr:DMT family transporter [Octadecabacter ascidiaceicola]SMX37402.1 EamA-like transporter family protein [Octadecabacter ascidiaceicola]
MQPVALWRVGLVMLTSMTLIVGGDVAAKVLTQDGFSPLFIAWTRFALACVVLLPFCGLTRTDAPALRDPRVLLRALLITGGISCILTALRTEPVANVFGAFFVGPIVAFALSALLLKERITLTRSFLLGLSFLGVLLVVKPGFGVSIGMGFAVLAGVLHGSYVVSTRWIAPFYRPRLLLFSQLFLGAIVLAPFGLTALPDSVSWAALGLIFVSAFGSALGNLMLVSLSKTTPSNVIAPLIYTQLIPATLLGFLVFSDWPDWASFIGLAIIFTTGVASLALSRR